MSSNKNDTFYLYMVMRMLCLWSGPSGLTMRLLLLRRLSVGLAVECSSCFSPTLNRDLYICCFGALMS